MIGDSRVSAGEAVVPDFVTSGSLWMEGETERTKALRYRAIVKASKACH
jgi:hypothetical protein